MIWVHNFVRDAVIALGRARIRALAVSHRHVDELEARRLRRVVERLGEV